MTTYIVGKLVCTKQLHNMAKLKVFNMLFEYFIYFLSISVSLTSRMQAINKLLIESFNLQDMIASTSYF